MSTPPTPSRPHRDTQGLLQRILWLDEELRGRRYPNLPELMERWEVSRRTAQNTVDHLRFSLDAPLEYDRKRGGYYYADPTFALPAVFLREGELLALLLAEELAGHYLGTAVEAPLRTAIAKLRRYLPEDATVDLEALRRQVHFSPTGTVEVSAALLESVRRAIKERFLLQIDYYTASRDEWQVRNVEQHFLDVAGPDWMLVAWDRWRDADRVFMLSRIREHAVLDERFHRRPELEPERYTRHRFRTERGVGEPVEVVLQFDAYQARWIQERTWHPSQVLEEQAGGGVILRLRAEVFDWKTGSITPASYLRTVDQLHWYALQAMHAWGVAPEAVRLIPVWLAPQLVTNELEITPEELESLETRIRERHSVLTGLLDAQAGCGPELALELWPLTEQVEFCRTCPFRGSCEGACRLQSSGPEPVFADPFAGSFAV